VDLERQPGSNAIAKLAIERTIAIEGIVRFVERAIGMQVGVWARPHLGALGGGPGRDKGLTTRTGAPSACRRSHPHTLRPPRM
jgi:hypothetical protein